MGGGERREQGSSIGVVAMAAAGAGGVGLGMTDAIERVQRGGAPSGGGGGGGRVPPEPRQVSMMPLVVMGAGAVGMGALFWPFIAPAIRRHVLPFVPATTQQTNNVVRALSTVRTAGAVKVALAGLAAVHTACRGLPLLIAAAIACLATPS